MILADTSVWIDHFRREGSSLASLLGGRQVVLHPFVYGELVCGNLTDRRRTTRMLADLRTAPVVAHGLVVRLVERHRLHGTGLGWVDVHLLAAAMVHQHTLMTLDAALDEAAARLGVAAHA